MDANLSTDITTHAINIASDARERIRAVSPDVMAAFERMEARRGARFSDGDLRMASRTEEFRDEYRRVSGQSLATSFIADNDDDVCRVPGLFEPTADGALA